MTRRRTLLWQTCGAVGLFLTFGCGQEQPLAQPLTPTSPSAAAPSSGPSPSPSPSPLPASTAPFSPFEADPAVVALRTFVRAAAVAVNAGDLSLPPLVAVSTPARQQQSQETFGSDLGGFAPGPYPLTPLGVQVVSTTSRRVPLCTLATGWALTAPGGEPREPRTVAGGTALLTLVGDTWKVDNIYADPKIDCSGVDVPLTEFS